MNAGSADSPAAPTVLVSWAHTNPNWDHSQAAAWQQDVESFDKLLRNHGIDTDL